MPTATWLPAADFSALVKTYGPAVAEAVTDADGAASAAGAAQGSEDIRGAGAAGAVKRM